MKNKQTKVIVVITVIVLLLCAILPMIILRLGDAFTDGKVYSANMKTIWFEQKLSEAEVLYIFQNGIWVDVSEEEMNLKEEELKVALDIALLPYRENSLIFEGIDEFTIAGCWPYRGYSNDSYSVSRSFWVINMRATDRKEPYLYALLDDETGKILMITYLCSYPIYDSDSVKLIELHDRLETIYGATFEKGLTYDDTGTSLYDINSRTYYVQSDFGTMGINLELTDYGFSVSPIVSNHIFGEVSPE